LYEYDDLGQSDMTSSTAQYVLVPLSYNFVFPILPLSQHLQLVALPLST
jgi:hypothetical protein